MLGSPRKIDLAITINILLIALSLILINYTNIDLNIQNAFFDFQNQEWLVDKREPIAKFFFYNLPKIFLGIAIFSSLIILLLGILPLGYKNKLPLYFTKYNYHQIIILFLGLALIPLIGGNIKKFTNIYCPNQLAIYDGQYPYLKIFDQYPQNFKQQKNGQCFPAGHAITGFCWMILFFVFKKRSEKLLGLMFGIVFGWILGLYQILKGAHFFGDTLISMLSCFLIALLIIRIATLYYKNSPYTISNL